MIQRIYLDTSVIGGCLDPEFSLWSRRLMDQAQAGKFRVVISGLVLKELEKAPGDVRRLLENIHPDFLEKIELSK